MIRPVAAHDAEPLAIVSLQLGPLFVDLSWDKNETSGTIGVGPGAPHFGFWLQLFNLSLQVIFAPRCWWTGQCAHAGGAPAS